MPWTARRSPALHAGDNARIVVLLKFQDPAVEKVNDDIVSYVKPMIVGSDGTSVVNVMPSETPIGSHLMASLIVAIDASAGDSVRCSRNQT